MKRSLHSTLRRVVRGVLVGTVLIGIFSHPAAFAISPAEYQKLIAELKDDRRIEAKEVTESLQKNFGKRSDFYQSQFSYDSLRTYYRKNIETLGGFYPPGLFSFHFDPFAKFDGKLRLGGGDIFLVPFLAIVPENATAVESMHFFALSANAGESRIPGLRASGPMNKGILRGMANANTKGKKIPFFLPYLSDVNGRAMGFRSAQLVLDLSANVEPCVMFDYNGLKNWSEHLRYSRNDQTQHPIELNNFAHPAGGDYNVSDHPDFAVSVLDILQPARMTFFLWKGEGKKNRADTRDYRVRVPDFILQIDLHQ